ncbi:Cinnamyl-alcohol dehydrogenase Flavonol reductase/cinnamoyl-CoA reductase [Stylosanthes scabra]|uniref:Cinnamyl-alcohol dehydrogenase Flavonol reductase/cinnamoyl-CoA reductase n=1 Tax=Stylosanthes scabra TaxID=79078 RepID=A0ABU6XT28_9FABA|nr:Cinnamyl-alcohol dehydrogenase Flavonol reductase/cinnamoyl-CoA reductase [Stylosanthes scabra]
MVMVMVPTKGNVVAAVADDIRGRGSELREKHELMERTTAVMDAVVAGNSVSVAGVAKERDRDREGGSKRERRDGKRTKVPLPLSEIEYRCFVGGLAWATNNEALEKAFSSYGEIVESKAKIDRLSSSQFGGSSFSPSLISPPFGFIRAALDKDCRNEWEVRRRTEDK